MPDITGLPYLADGVASFLQKQGITATVLLGWREKQQQINEGDGTANRIVIQPGDPSGGAGALDEPRQAGHGPRMLWPPPPVSGEGAQSPDDQVSRELNDWAEKATVFVWAVDASDASDERKQYIAVRSLLQSVRQALQFVGRNSLDVSDLEWVDAEDTERQYGRELALSITYHAPLFDVAEEIAHPTTVDITGQFETTE